MMGVLCGKPLVLHEQNSVAGLANKVLAQVADRVLSAFPGVLPKSQWVGNPMRSAFLEQTSPAQRLEGRQGVLKVLVVGGSLGAQVLNSVVPQALALIPVEQRPQVIHQGGAKHLDTLTTNYAAAGVQAELTAFIDDTAAAFAQADLVICRAGASTVSEIAAVGAAALFVPFPHAVDNHQTVNAKFLVEQQAGWCMPQHSLTPQALADFIRHTNREQLLQAAQNAYALRKTSAAQAVVAACEEVSA
jgi:UDP-N-acetylglucosamine--N-acetylmuramyl-(pentapeptide) pyrophosphoryl-undecaprenol N-acetylglucosamine transferase